MAQIVNECPIILGYKLLELLCSRVAADSVDLSTPKNEGPIIWVTNYWHYSSGLAPGM